MFENDFYIVRYVWYYLKQEFDNLNSILIVCITLKKGMKVAFKSIGFCLNV